MTTDFHLHVFALLEKWASLADDVRCGEDLDGVYATMSDLADWYDSVCADHGLPACACGEDLDDE